MKYIIKNIWTSVAGSISGLPLIIEGINQKNWIHIITGFGILVTGLLAKDGYEGAK